MKSRQLGNTDIHVTPICLGTMTWGKQNTQTEAFEQLDYAMDRGINFIDTAELYPVPPEAETYGATESIIGNWLKQSGKRDDIILASKVASPREWCAHIRDGDPKLNRANITTALDNTLKRLKTDYLDLYQVHWPERSTNFFGTLGYGTEDQSITTPIRETMAILGELVKQGKVRHVGISNETPGARCNIFAAQRPITFHAFNPFRTPTLYLIEVSKSALQSSRTGSRWGYSPILHSVLARFRVNTEVEDCRKAVGSPCLLIVIPATPILKESEQQRSMLHWPIGLESALPRWRWPL